MALARLALKNLQQRASYSASLMARNVSNPAPSPEKQRWASLFLRGLSSAAEEKAGAAHEVAVQEGGKKSKLSPRRRGRRSGNLWRRNGHSIPDLWDMIPSGLGNALMQATENINRLLENVGPSQLMGRAREHDDGYKLQYHMPGVGKDDVKITVEDRVLSIQGEHKDDKEHESDDEWSSSSSYGYYNTSLLLPEDAKIDEIKAEMKDGVLKIVIPKIDKANKDVKEVKVY